MSKWKIGGLVAALGLVASLALAQQGPSPDQRANGYRQALMMLIAGNMGPMGGMAQGRAPYNAQVVMVNAERIAFLTSMIPDAFARDTHMAKLETEALAKIWTDKADFDAHAREAQTKAMDLLWTVRGGDEDATKAAIGQLGRACGGCHDDYREEDD